MQVPRQFSLAVQYLLDQWVPPAIRDSRLFMLPPTMLLLRGSSQDFMHFRDEVFGYTKDEFSDLYRRVESASLLQGETDLNRRCIEAIDETIVGGTVLEAGAGRGFLAGRLSQNFEVTATDIVTPDHVRERYDRVSFQEANVEALPFADDSFDTVVCTHTLEHVQNLTQALRELRRVAKQRLVIVVPRQRPYRYAFNLHVHFFPYPWTIQGAFGYRAGAVIRDLGDWFYSEDAPFP